MLVNLLILLSLLSVLLSFIVSDIVDIYVIVIFQAKRVAETLRAAVTGQLRFRQVYFKFIIFKH